MFACDICLSHFSGLTAHEPFRLSPDLPGILGQTRLNNYILAALTYIRSADAPEI